MHRKHAVTGLQSRLRSPFLARQARGHWLSLSKTSLTATAKAVDSSAADSALFDQLLCLTQASTLPATLADRMLLPLLRPSCPPLQRLWNLSSLRLLPAASLHPWLTLCLDSSRSPTLARRVAALGRMHGDPRRLRHSR